MPKAPARPANAPHNMSPSGGMASPVSHAIACIANNPQAWATATTRKTLARLAAKPPEKSPPPQEAAANRLSPEASMVAGVILAYNTRCSDCEYPRHRRFDLRALRGCLARKYCHFSNFRRFGISQENSIKHISHPPLDL